MAGPDAALTARSTATSRSTTARSGASVLAQNAGDQPEPAAILLDTLIGRDSA
ncbi:MAG TPA: hypothetical protein VGC57_04320 [Cellulomonas sp.]